MKRARVIAHLESLTMGVAIGYTLICWLADLLAVGNMHPGVRYEIMLPVGMVSAVGGFILGLATLSRRPMLSWATMISSLLWVVWAVLPRV